jgi:phage terminase small subunit
MPRTVKKDTNLQPGKPEKPANLSPRAAREWDRLIGELESANIQVSTAHRTLLQLAATIAADIAKAYAVVEKEGEYIQAKSGPVQHPASKRLDALRRDYIKVMTTLGTRAQAAPPPDNGPTLDDVLNG